MLKIIHNQTRTKPGAEPKLRLKPTLKHSQDGIRFTETYKRRYFTIF